MAQYGTYALDSCHCARYGHHDLCRHHDSKAGPPRDRHGAQREHGQTRDNQGALASGRIDEGAPWGMDREPCEATHGSNKTNRCLILLLLGHQEHAEVRAKGAAHIGKEKIYKVQRADIAPRSLYHMPPFKATIRR
jgi:hypothetical protein